MKHNRTLKIISLLLTLIFCAVQVGYARSVQTQTLAAAISNAATSAAAKSKVQTQQKGEYTFTAKLIAPPEVENAVLEIWGEKFLINYNDLGSYSGRPGEEIPPVFQMDKPMYNPEHPLQKDTSAQKILIEDAGFRRYLLTLAKLLMRNLDPEVKATEIVDVVRVRYNDLTTEVRFEGLNYIFDGKTGALRALPKAHLFKRLFPSLETLTRDFIPKRGDDTDQEMGALKEVLFQKMFSPPPFRRPWPLPQTEEESLSQAAEDSGLVLMRLSGLSEPPISPIIYYYLVAPRFFDFRTHEQMAQIYAEGNDIKDIIIEMFYAFSTSVLSDAFISSWQHMTRGAFNALSASDETFFRSA